MTVTIVVMVVVLWSNGFESSSGRVVECGSVVVKVVMGQVTRDGVG